MKGFIELTDSLDRRCSIKVSCITQVSERPIYRVEELKTHPELGRKYDDGEWRYHFKTTCIESIIPCDNLYVKETYDDVLKMMEEALEQ